MGYADRINQIVESQGFSNTSDFAKFIGISRSTVATVLTSDSTPGTPMITAIVEKYKNLNARWLLTGEGDMWLEDEKPEMYRDESSDKLTPEQELEFLRFKVKFFEEQNKRLIRQTDLLIKYIQNENEDEKVLLSSSKEHRLKFREQIEKETGEGLKQNV